MAHMHCPICKALTEYRSGTPTNRGESLPQRDTWTVGVRHQNEWDAGTVF